jgi:hypothetical protein
VALFVARIPNPPNPVTHIRRISFSRRERLDEVVCRLVVAVVAHLILLVSHRVLAFHPAHGRGFRFGTGNDLGASLTSLMQGLSSCVSALVLHRGQPKMEAALNPVNTGAGSVVPFRK